MATLTPGMWKSCDPRQHPDDIRRERSGFWTHEYRIENQEHVWRCDLHKMNEAVKDILMNRTEFERFSSDPHRYLDMTFGEGTARAYFTKHPANEHYMNYRMSREMQRDRYIGIDPARGRDQMALASYANMLTGSTFTNSTTTSGTTGAFSSYISDEMARQQNRMVDQTILGSLPKQRKNAAQPIRTDRLKGIPFKIEHGSNLLDSLQRQFNIWTKNQLELVRG